MLKKSTRRFAAAGALLLVAALSLGGGHAVAQEDAGPRDARLDTVRRIETTYEMPTYSSLEQWLPRRAWLREHALICCGIWPKPPTGPVEPVIFATVDCGDYTVSKVYFASRPGLYVTGNLYVPTTGTAPYPAVANPHGHWANGRMANEERGSIAGRCIGQARRGMIAFSYDMMGYNDADQYDHRFLDPRLTLWGVSAMGFQTLNSVRVLDFLASLPQADPTRLAVTGESGGGTQTFMLVAVDERLAAAAPVNMVSAHYQGGCVCENGPNLRVETLNPEIVSVMAPKPLLLVSCTGDWTANTPTVEGPMVQSIYGLYRAADQVSWVQEDAEHNYNTASREHVYRFLAKTLYGVDDPEAAAEQPFEMLDEAHLRVWADREPPADRMDLEALSESVIAEKQAAFEALYPDMPGEREAFERVYRPAYEHALLADEPATEVLARRGEARVLRNVEIEELRLGREGLGDSIPATLLRPVGGPASTRAVVAVTDEGRAGLQPGGEPGEFLSAVLARGATVLTVDPFLVGEAVPEGGAPDRAADVEFFTTYNRTDVAERVRDLVTAAKFAAGLEGIESVRLVGFGEAGLWCLLAQPIAGADRCAADAAGFDLSDAEFLARCPVPLIRQAGDFRTAFALSAPAPLLLWNAPPDLGAWATRAYEGQRACDALRVEPASPAASDLAAWLAR